MQDVGKAGVLSLNNLTYQLAPDLSVAITRTVTSQFFQSQTHAPGSSGICIFNTGSSFVNGKESFLVLDVQNLSRTAAGAATNAWFGAYGGSAANFINSLTILSRSGTVLEKIDRANQLSSIKALYRHDDGWRRFGPGSAMGMSSADTPVEDLAWTGANTVGEIKVPGEVIRFVIPLSHISPLFDSVETLLPCQLCSGLRFEIIFETAKSALVGKNDTDIMSYQILGTRIQTESYLLSDLVMRSLSEQSASAGLEIVGKTYHNSFGSRANSNLNLDMGKSCSRALSFVLKERPSTVNLTSTDSRFKSMVLDSISHIDEFQARVGSLYFPMSSIRAGAAGARGSSPELYVTALRAHGKFYQDQGVCTGVSEPQYRAGHAVFSQDLERSSIQQLSGIPLSQSRTLSVNASWGGDTPIPEKSTEIDFYLCFVCLIRVFSSNSVIEI